MEIDTRRSVSAEVDGRTLFAEVDGSGCTLIVQSVYGYTLFAEVL